MKRLSEKQIIDLMTSVLRISKKRTLWNDDIATVPLGNRILAFKCDMFVQSTDAPKQMRPWQMARKSIVSCLSDFACKGVKPLASLISLGVPKAFTSESIASLARGFKIAEREFGVKIIGGDINESKELVIDCCMVGIANHVIKRSGAKDGELIVTSGPFGYSASGLKILLKNARAKPSFKKKASQAVLMPKPRLEFGLSLTKFATSAMDSSDGLAFTLYEMSEHSRKRFVVDELPTASDVKEFARKNRYNFNELVFYGGEEYEIVATIQKRYLGKVQRLAKQAGCKLFVIGRVERGKGVLMVENGKKIKIEKRGWEHLSRA